MLRTRIYMLTWKEEDSWFLINWWPLRMSSVSKRHSADTCRCYSTVSCDSDVERIWCRLQSENRGNGATLQLLQDVFVVRGQSLRSFNWHSALSLHWWINWVQSRLLQIGTVDSTDCRLYRFDCRFSSWLCLWSSQLIHVYLYYSKIYRWRWRWWWCCAKECVMKLMS